MSQPSDTRASLLIRLRDSADSEAWNEFVQIYEPLLKRIASRFGLQDADAEEMRQEVFLAVHQKLATFHATGQPGAFRKWLMTVARNTVIDRLRSRASRERFRQSAGITQLMQIADPKTSDLEEAYVREERRALFAWASEQVRASCDPSTWSAFWETSVRQRGIDDVARELRMSAGQVYVARCRTLARLRSAVEVFQS